MDKKRPLFSMPAVLCFLVVIALHVLPCLTTCIYRNKLINGVYQSYFTVIFSNGGILYGSTYCDIRNNPNFAYTNSLLPPPKIGFHYRIGRFGSKTGMVSDFTNDKRSWRSHISLAWLFIPCIIWLGMSIYVGYRARLRQARGFPVILVGKTV